MDISNGEHIGVSLFVQGCHFHCKNCFNQETWDFNGGQKWTEEIKNEFLRLINRPVIKRVSILGGEPLTEENLPDILSLIEEIKYLYPEKKIWIYTGYTWENIAIDPLKYEVIRNIDFLIDGQFEEDKKDLKLKFKGSSNQRLIDVQKSISCEELILYENEI